MQAHLREGKQVVEDAEGMRACEDEPEKGWERPEVLHCYRIGCVRPDGGEMEWVLWWRKAELGAWRQMSGSRNGLTLQLSRSRIINRHKQHLPRVFS